MALKDDLESDVSTIFKSAWTERDGTVVPSPAVIKLANDAVNLTATVLYADLSDSTKLVDQKTPQFAAEIYKTFLLCAAKIIKHFGGTITAYDGDRIMAVYIGKTKNTSAVKTGLKINGAVNDIIMPALKAQYPTTSYNLRHVIGIDTSKLLVARTGVRGDNDLVWVGRAANWAAKLCSLDHNYPTRITKAVYDNMLDEAKFGGDPKRNMWEHRLWTAMDNADIYRSNWRWSI